MSIIFVCNGGFNEQQNITKNCTRCLGLGKRRNFRKQFYKRHIKTYLGVSNHNLEEIKQAAKILKAHGLKLSAVQNHYSLINLSSEKSGILEYCKQNNIYFFSYMVLEQGALSGKYDTKNLMPEGSARAQTYNPVMDKLELLNEKLAKLAEKYNVETAQIPIAWAISKGTLPIIGVTKVKHVEDAVKAANITLTQEETEELEKFAESLQINAIRFWEKEMK